ncbi:MAG: hypothetical protein WBW49_13625 [Candidatus Acidiferrum sp.]
MDDCATSSRWYLTPVSEQQHVRARHTWTGMVVGALIGLFWPPYLVWEAAIGASRALRLIL